MKKIWWLSFVVLAGCGAGSSTAIRVEEAAVDPLAEQQRLIAFHEERVKTDPAGAIGWAMLSEAHLELAQNYDDDQAGIAAEKAARQSLFVRRVGNHRAARRLAESLLQQHRFKEAEDAARLAMKLSGNSIQTVRLLGDVLLELGKYEEFSKLASARPELASEAEGKATLARWAENRGEIDRALTLLDESAMMAREAGAKSAEAWFLTQRGWTALRTDRMETAAKCFDAALALQPKDRKAWAGRVQLALRAKNWSGVLAAAKRVETSKPMTDVVAAEAMALTQLGRLPEAEKKYKLMDELNDYKPIETHSHGRGHEHSHAAEGRHTHNRLYAVALADAGRHLRYAHHAAEEDLDSRRDIHAYDAFAWATYRFWLLDPAAKREEGNGLLKEAATAIRKATALGTKDATILAHAREILAAEAKLMPRG